MAFFESRFSILGCTTIFPLHNVDIWREDALTPSGKIVALPFMLMIYFVLPQPIHHEPHSWSSILMTWKNCLDPKKSSAFGRSFDFFVFKKAAFGGSFEFFILLYALNFSFGLLWFQVTSNFLD